MRILVTGAAGKLGAYLVEHLKGREVLAWSGRAQVDLSDQASVLQALTQAGPDVVVHTAALSAISDCYKNPELARQVNTEATRLLAQHAPRLIYCSTDLVFGGDSAPYRESDPARPLSLYGKTKLEAEAAVREAGGVVARLALMYGPSARGGFHDQQVARLQAGEPVPLFEDEFRTPLAFEAAAEALGLLVQSDFAGLVHVGGPRRLSRLQMGLELAQELGLPTHSIVPTKARELDLPEPRPADVSLDSTRFRDLFPDWSGKE